jgi:tape measure domain-containing protein
MADVTVEFGATDTGLEKTLKAVQDELTQLKGKVSSGELSMTELESTMKRIGQVTSMEKNIKAIGDQSDGTSKDVNEMGKAMEETGKKGESGFAKIVGAAALAGGAVKLGMMAVDAAFAAVSGAFGAFGESINKAADFQQLETSFNVLIGNTTLAKTFLEDLSKFAASTPFTIPGLADASKTLLAFGVMSSEVIPIVSMLGDVSQGNEDKLKSLALAFGKVESQGKLTGEELNQMIDSGFNPLEHISEKTGKSMAELRKEMEKGSITSAMIREAFVAATSEGGKFFEMTKKQGMTFNGVMSTMQDTIDDLYRRFGRPIIDALTPIIQKWSDRISAIAPLFDLIGQAVGNTITYFSDLIDKVFNVEKAVGNIGGSIKAIAGGEYAAGIENLFLSMKVWAMGTGNEIYKHLGAAFTTAAEFASKIFDPSGELGKTVVGAFEYIGTKAAVTIMRTLAEGLKGSTWTSGIALSLNQAANESNVAANKIADNFKGAGGRIKEQMTEAGAALPKSFSENYKEIPPLFDDIKSTQDQIDANNLKIAASTKEIVVSDQEAVAEAKAYFDQWQKSEDLKKKAAEKAAEDLKIEQDKIALKQQELKFQLELAEAQAAGDTERVDALTAQKKYAEDIQKALAAGLDPEQAALFATNMAIAANNSANITQYDKDGNPLFFKAAENAGKLNESLKSATGFADTLSKMQEIKAMDKAANSAKAAKDELKAMDKLLGTDLAQKSFPDLVKKLNLDKIGQTGEEQIRAVVTYFNQVKTDLSKNPIDSEKGQEKIRELVKFLGGTPMKAELVVDYQKAKTATDTAFSSVPTTLDADKSVKGLRDSVKDGIELDVAAKSGVNGLLDAIKTAVEAIKTAVEKIEPKLPQQVLA